MEKKSIFDLIMGIEFMDLLHYLQQLKMFYLGLWYLGKLIQIFLTKNEFEGFENLVNILGISYNVTILLLILYI